MTKCVHGKRETLKLKKERILWTRGGMRFTSGEWEWKQIEGRSEWK